MACPACREAGTDKSGDHLTVFPGGKFSCAVHPGDKEHNRRIIALKPELGKNGETQIGQSKRRAGCSRTGRIVAEYSYQDANRKELFQVVRMEPKDFRQRHRVGGEWVWNVKGITIVPYRLPKVLASQTVWIVEGEKDVETLERLGIVATCNAGGAGKWQAEWSSLFVDKQIVICGDNDEPGRKHVQQVAATLEGTAKSISPVSAQDFNWRRSSLWAKSLRKGI